MRIYISGPITGVENYRDNFEKAKRMPFGKIQQAYARHDGDMVKVFRYIKWER